MLNPDHILTAIEAIRPKPETERGYIGASEIGHECDRYLWLKFHRVTSPEVFEPRMLRLFARGQREEHYLETLLRDAGIEFETDCFSQAGFRDGFFAGHGDGTTPEFCVEYKTHNKASFDKLKRGELIKTHPKHFAQCIVYSDKFKKSGAIYVAVCKDDDRLFVDVIPADKEKAEEYQLRADHIASSDTPPDRIAKLPTSFPCKFCSARDVCFGFAEPRVNCRNCTSAEKFREHGTFGCEVMRTEGTEEQRLKNDPLPADGHCERHSFNPYLINDLKQWQIIEFFPEHRAVKYKRPNGEVIINGAAPFGVPSTELK